MRSRGCRTIALLVGIVALFTATAVLAQGTPTMDWISIKKDMPHPVYWSATAAWDGKIYVIGGISGETGTDTNIMQVYDIASDTWTMGPPRVQSVRLASAAAINGKIYVTGGRDEAAPWDYHEVFDTATGTWGTAKKLPSVLRGHTAVAAGGKLYTFGGNRGTASAIYSNTVNIYDPATDNWTTGRAAPVRWAYGGADYDETTGKVFFVAGDNGSCTDCAGEFPKQSYGYHVASNTWDSSAASYAALVTDYPGVHMQSVSAGSGKVYSICGGYYDGDTDRGGFPMVLVLNTATNTWDYAPSVPDPIARLSAMSVSYGGKIYVLGGLPDGQWLQTVDVMDPATDTYFAPYPDSGEPRQGPIVQAVGTKLYAIGGWYNGNATGSVMVFDTAARPGAWSTTNAVDPTPRYAAASGVWNGKIVVSGGAATDGTPVGGNTVLYDPATDTFSALAADPAARSGAAGAVVGDHFYVFGGSDAEGNPVAFASDLNLATGTWTAMTALPVAIDGPSAAAVGGKVYIFGGFDGTAKPDNGMHDKVFIFDPATRGYSEGAESPYAVIYGAAAAYGNYIVMDSGLHRYYSVDDDTVYAEMAQTQTIYHPATNTFTTAPRPWGKWYHGAAVVGNNLYSVLGVDWSYLCTRTDVAQLGSGGPTCTLTCTANAAPTSGVAPLAVNFTATATATDCSGQPAYAWAFGDGATANTQNGSHTYAAAGTYTWTLTVTVDDQTCTQTGTVTVTAPPCTLTCNATVATTGQVGVDVIFVGTATATNCTGQPSYAWDYGDGNQGVGNNTTHAYANGGTYNWTLTVTVDDQTCTRNGTVTISDVAVCTLTCTASATPTSGTEPLAVTFAGTGTATNCVGQPAYSWAFGDGGTSSEQNPSHTYAAAGTYTWTLTVTVDDKTCSQTGSITVNPAGNAPNVAIGAATGEVGATVELPITLSNNGATVCGTSNKISYDDAFLTFVEATLGPAGSAAGKQVFVNQDPVTKVITLGVSGFNTTPIADGVVAYVKFTIKAGASGSTDVTSVCGSSDCAGNDLTTACTNGMVTVQTGPTAKVDLSWTAPTGEGCFAPTNLTATLVPEELLFAPGIAIGTATAREGESVTLPITLSNMGDTVCGTSNKITYDFNKLDYVEATLGPAGSAAGKQVFVNQNPTTKVITLGVSGFNTTPIADGIVAYVTFTIKAGATGDIVIENQCGASDCAGNDLTSNCTNGMVSVYTPPVLQGYDVYRGLSESGPFDKINAALIPAGTTTYRDMMAPIAGLWYEVKAVYNNCTSDPAGPVLIHTDCTLECTANATPTSGDRPLTVLFTSTTTQTPADCAGAETYLWDFGDNSIPATTKNATYTYTQPGTWHWTYTVTAGTMTCTKTGEVTVTIPPCAITVCTATASPASGIVPLLVNFSGNVVTSGECGTPTYLWTFGDGATANTKDASHTYAEDGEYNWTFTVTVDGLTCSKSGTIQVLCDAPMVTKVTKVPDPFRLKIDATGLKTGYKVYIAGQSTAWTNIKVKSATQFVIKGANSYFPKDGTWVDIKVANPSGCAYTVQYNKKLKQWRVKP